MLYLFDLDDTLISGYMNNPGKEYDRWEVLPGRWAKIAALRNAGHSVCIVTNQGGVAFGHITGDQADAKIERVLSLLALQPTRQNGSGLRRVVYACYSDERGKSPWNDPADAARRKPSGAMIREAMRDHWSAAREGVLFVGDRPEDEAAAKDAGVPFQWAHGFFGDENR